MRTKPRPVDPLVSVLIPTHNRVEILTTRSLASALRQTYKNLEILVLAHGCTDGTADVVRAIGDPRVRVIEVPRNRLGYPASAEHHWLVGPVRPLNAGTRQAQGMFLAVIGDDDEWTDGHVERSVSWLLQTGDDFVSSQTAAVDSKGRQFAPPPDHYGDVEVGGVSTWVFRKSLRALRWNIHSWRKGWNRPNDIDFVIRIRRTGARMSFLPEIGHIWAPRPGERELGVSAYISNKQWYEGFFQLGDKKKT